MPRANMNSVFEFDFPLPPLPEQKRIVAILDEGFEGIDRAIANTEKNLANSRELFESYLNAIFTQKGDGWEEKKLEDICKEITVGHVGSMASKYKDSGIPFLRSQNILPFRINLDNVVFIDKEFHSALKKSQLKPGYLAIVRTGYPGTAAVIPEEIGIANCSDLVIVKPGRNINAHYLCLFFNSIFGKLLVGSRLVGAAQKHFNITTAKKVLIPFPSLTEQNRLVTKMDELAAETQRLETIYRRKIAALNELKQSILQKAFTGELTVRPSSPTAADTPKTVKEEIAA
jgi:type I restriction enzyme S subunit